MTSWGRHAFLARYGFGPAKEWVLVHGGKRYDSKAIVGAAHGFQHPSSSGPSSRGTSLAACTPRSRSSGRSASRLGHSKPAGQRQTQFAFTREDCELFAQVPEKVPFKDDFVPPEDKAKFKSIWSRLKASGSVASPNAADSGWP